MLNWEIYSMKQLQSRKVYRSETYSIIYCILYSYIENMFFRTSKKPMSLKWTCLSFVFHLYFMLLWLVVLTCICEDVCSALLTWSPSFPDVGRRRTFLCPPASWKQANVRRMLEIWIHNSVEIDENPRRERRSLTSAPLLHKIQCQSEIHIL